MLIPTADTYPEPSLRRTLLAHAMRYANAAGGEWWYQIKDSLCRAYGREDGYDLQRIEAHCWHCSGEGCGSCGNGIHHITRTVLRRYDVEGIIFHRPIKKVFTDERFDDYRAEAKNVFTHHLLHRPVSPVMAREVALWLLLLTVGWRIFRMPFSWFFTSGFTHASPRPWHPLQFVMHLRKTPARLRSRCSVWWRWNTRDACYQHLVRWLTSRLYPRGERGPCPQLAAEAAYHGPPDYRITVWTTRDTDETPF